MGVVLQVVDGRISLEDMWPGAVAAKSVLETELKPERLDFAQDVDMAITGSPACAQNVACRELACCTSALDLSVHPAVLV